MESTNVIIKPDPDSILAVGKTDCDFINNHNCANDADNTMFLRPIKEERIESEVDPAEFITEDVNYMFLYDTQRIESESAAEHDESSVGKDCTMTVKQEMESSESDCDEVLGVPSELSAPQETAADGAPRLRTRRNIEMIECHIDPMTVNTIVTQNTAPYVAGCDAQGQHSKCARGASQKKTYHPVQGVKKTKLAAKERVAKGDKKRKLIDQLKEDVDVEKRLFSCHLCQKVCSSKFSLNRHIAVHHLGDKPYECQVCQKTFGQSEHLKRHSRNHTSGKAAYGTLVGVERPYECQLCKKTFTQLGSLRAHTRTHTGEKPFECVVCKMTFTQFAHLKVHSRVHTGEKPYKCKVCKKSFSRSSTLLDHKKIHTGEKPYTCGVCERTFARSNQLKIHTTIHTGEKPFNCSRCEMTFNRAHHLKRHIRVYH